MLFALKPLTNAGSKNGCGRNVLLTLLLAHCLAQAAGRAAGHTLTQPADARAVLLLYDTEPVVMWRLPGLTII